ncbi:hypothetical protein IE53DRAFT_386978 [Violaceomyces palustris]|uniref:Uncharacterized protein n=1 Tax=Violaceomyces palustris TaxID=1673888 RepID=A0ACD0NXZ1_9BASI|nr:hypothetical protein IE53DRAFT_386978 [Violaceomyces palustris]
MPSKKGNKKANGATPAGSPAKAQNGASHPAVPNTLSHPSIHRGPAPVDVENYNLTPKSLMLLPKLALFILSLGALNLFFHYRLPPPKPATSFPNAPASLAAQYDPSLNRIDPEFNKDSTPLYSHFSEGNAVSVMQHLSVDIGYRIVGTRQHIQAEDWVEQVLRRYEGFHETGKDGDGSRTQVEVWKQIGDGAHRFDFMSNVVWKKYYSMSNLVVRISDGTDESKEHSLLLNAHLDSTLPSPGGADDGIGVAILLEALRILTLPGTGRKLKHSVILLFNDGEESLQDASHLYITQHNETKDSVRAVVNLEACGTSGPELLFQATSAEMIEAYSKVPHPFGTVLANDVFSTGLILSDTDFRQFIEYGNGLSGLDMAIVGNSYLYHTRQDVPENLQSGATQHFGENTLAIIEHLCLSNLSLSSIRPNQHRRDLPVYFSVSGKFMALLTPKGFRTLVLGTSAFVNFQLSSAVRAEKHLGSLKMTMLSIFGSLLSLIGAILGANVVAAIMAFGLGKGMSWFTFELYPVVLYGPPAIASIMSVQLLISSFVTKGQQPYFERASLSGLGIFFTIALLILNAFGIGSAYLMLLAASSTILCSTINDFAFIGFARIEDRQVNPDNRVSAFTYFLLSLVPSVIGIEGLVSFLDLFVPLTGRMGEVSPADNIIATIVAFLSFLCLPICIPLSHRFGRERLKKGISYMLMLTVVLMAVFASPLWKPFDHAHPKRLFVHQVENITSGDWFLNLGAADPAPGFKDLSNDVQKVMGISGEEATLMEMNEYNPDFDVLYPVSDFLTPYKFQLPTPSEATRYASPAPSSQHFKIEAIDEVVDLAAGTRRVTLEIQHPGIIWSVIAFDADVIEWDLPSEPPKGLRRHHIKEVSRHGLDKWSVNLLLRLDEKALEAYERGGSKRKTDGRYGKLVTVNEAQKVQDPARSDLRVEDASRLWIDFSGLDSEGMFPQHRNISRGRPGMESFAKMDEFMKQKHPEVDVMMLNVIAGVAIA